eukprot:PhM_4_TR8301/c2_g1_i1/m.24980
MSLQAKLQELTDAFEREPLRSMFDDDGARRAYLQEKTQAIIEQFVAAPPDQPDAAQHANTAVVDLIRQTQEESAIPWARSRRLHDIMHTARTTDQPQRQFLDAAKTQSIPIVMKKTNKVQKL